MLNFHAYDWFWLPFHYLDVISIHLRLTDSFLGLHTENYLFALQFSQKRFLLLWVLFLVHLILVLLWSLWMVLTVFKKFLVLVLPWVNRIFYFLFILLSRLLTFLSFHFSYGGLFVWLFFVNFDSFGFFFSLFRFLYFSFTKFLWIDLFYRLLCFKFFCLFLNFDFLIYFYINLLVFLFELFVIYWQTLFSYFFRINLANSLLSPCRLRRSFFRLLKILLGTLSVHHSIFSNGILYFFSFS